MTYACSEKYEMNENKGLLKKSSKHDKIELVGIRGIKGYCKIGRWGYIGVFGTLGPKILLILRNSGL